MKSLLVASATAALLVLVGCTGGPEEEPAPPPSPQEQAPQPDEPATEPIAEVVEPKWSQDLWLFNRIGYFTPGGADNDPTDAITSGLENRHEPAQTVDLGDGAVFEAYDILAPTVVGPNGQVRPDVEVLAGLMYFQDETVLAVLATPNADAEHPIGLEDDIEVDLTSLATYLVPGYPMYFDFTFVQTLPGSDPVDATPLELLKHRFGAGQFNFFGDQEGEEAQVLMYENALGVAVEGSTRMSMSGKGKISEPGLTGFRKGIWKARKGTSGGLIGYFKEFGKGAKGSNDLINCNLGGPCGPPNHTPPRKNCAGHRCGSAHGDPHIQTFDGLAYSPQAVGEFLLADSDGFTVQMRTEPLGSSRAISVVTGVAVETAGQQFVMSNGLNGGPPLLFVNGAPVPLTDLAQEIDAGTVAVTASSKEVMIMPATGERVTVNMRRSNLSLFVDPGQLNNLEGMLGDGDGEPENDLRTRGGKDLAPNIVTDSDVFYGTYVNSWRLTQDESLFIYLPGQDTETMTDLSFPSEHLTIDSIPEKELKQPTMLCERAGIMDPVFLNNCIFDYWVTGDTAFIGATKLMDLHKGLSTGFYQLDESYDSEVAPKAGQGGTQAGDFPDGHGPEEGQSVEDYLVAQWRWNPHSRYTQPDTFTHYCPPGGDPAGSVWGGGPQGYTSDSSVCTSAVHQGLITASAGGLVSAAMVGSRDSYETQPAANGVTPAEWLKPWSDGYILE